MKYILATFLTIYSIVSYGNTTCEGKLNYVALNPDNGTVKMNYGYGTQYHCQLDEEFNGVDVESCKSMYSLLLAAQMAGKTIQVRYNDDFVCSAEALGDYTTTKHKLYWVQIKN